MLRYFFLFILFFSVCEIQAQTTIKYSESFPEPEGRWRQLLSLKNDITAYVNVTFDFIEVRVYDSTKKRTGMQKIKHSQWTDRKMSASEFLGVYEINGQLAMFMSQQMKHNTPVLMVVMLDPLTGRLLDSKELLSIGEGRERHPFSVIVNELTEGYAIVFPEDNKHTSYKIDLFDKFHKLTSQATLSPPEGDRIYLKQVLFNKDGLHVFYNEAPLKEDGLKTPLSFGVLKNGQNVFDKYKTSANVLSAAHSDFIFNERKGYYQAVIMGQTKVENKSKMLGNVTQTTVYYSTELLFFDPVKHTVLGQFEIGAKDLDDYAKQTLHIEDGFNGLYNKQILNEDGSTDIIFEEQSSISNSYTTTTLNGNLGIVHLDDNIKLEHTYIIRKAQVSGSGAMRDPMKIGEFYSYSYFTSPSAAYVVFNDIPENYNAPINSKPHTIGTVTDANAVIYKLANGKVERSYLFGNPKDKFTTKFSLNNSAIYCREDNMYITLMVDHKKGVKQSHIVWVNFE